MQVTRIGTRNSGGYRVRKKMYLEKTKRWKGTGKLATPVYHIRGELRGKNIPEDNRNEEKGR